MTASRIYILIDTLSYTQHTLSYSRIHVTIHFHTFTIYSPYTYDTFGYSFFFFCDKNFNAHEILGCNFTLVAKKSLIDIQIPLGYHTEWLNNKNVLNFTIQQKYIAFFLLIRPRQVFIFCQIYFFFLTKLGEKKSVPIENREIVYLPGNSITQGHKTTKNRRFYKSAIIFVR